MKQWIDYYNHIGKLTIKEFFRNFLNFMDNNNNSSEIGHELVISAVEKLFSVNNFDGFNYRKGNTLGQWIVDLVDDWDDEEYHDDYSNYQTLRPLLYTDLSKKIKLKTLKKRSFKYVSYSEVNEREINHFHFSDHCNNFENRFNDFYQMFS